MTDTEQLHQNFLRDFTELLQRYNAEFERGSGHYGEFSEISFFGIYEHGETIRPYSYLSLPSILP
jgi:hypothetical protein